MNSQYLSSRLLLTGAIVVGAFGLAYKFTFARKKRFREGEIPDALLSGHEYMAELEAAIAVALIAGRNISKAIDKKKNVESKGDIDFVTSTDKDNELLIFNALKTKFPDHDFIGEVSFVQEFAIVLFC